MDCWWFYFVFLVVVAFFFKELNVWWVGRGRGSGRDWSRQGYDQIYLNSKTFSIIKKRY